MDWQSFDASSLRAGLENLIDDRDYAMWLVPHLDYESQLQAMRALLRRTKAASDATSTQIAELAEWAKAATGAEHYRAVDDWTDALYASVYTDAAASMAAVGMFAPFIEAIFCSSLAELGMRYDRLGLSPPPDKRWKRARSDDVRRWDCHAYFRTANDVEPDNLILGLPQLCRASGLDKHFSHPETYSRIEALFAYRNRMFHMGFEWPAADRRKFSELISKKRWQAYFSCSKRNDEPWIYYLTETFVGELPQFVDDLLSDLGGFVKTLPSEIRNA